jgi:tRNA dimethylallyltransferase
LKASRARTPAKPSTNNIIPVIVGPTGSGKTAVGIALAKRLNGEVISADSRQIYKYLTIGTAKPLPKGKPLSPHTGPPAPPPPYIPVGNHSRGSPCPHRERGYYVKGIPHHLIDFLDPGERFSAGDFVNFAKKTIKDIQARDKTPIVVGGTGLYIKALVDGLAPLPPANDKIRYELSSRITRYGLKSLHVELEKVDPVSARKIPVNNVQRLIRALEVYKLTGIPISEWHKKTMRPTNEKFLFFGLSWPKALLYQNIEERSLRILPGMIKESRILLKKGYPADCQGLQSLGYREALAYIKGEIDKTELLERLIRSTKQLAKRQMTWFRANKSIHWIPCGPKFRPEKTAEKIYKSFALA